MRDGCLMWRLQLGHGELQHETHPQHMHIRASNKDFTNMESANLRFQIKTLTLIIAKQA